MKEKFLFDDPFSAEEFLEQVQTERKNLDGAMADYWLRFSKLEDKPSGGEVGDHPTHSSTQCVRCRENTAATYLWD